MIKWYIDITQRFPQVYYVQIFMYSTMTENSRLKNSVYTRRRVDGTGNETRRARLTGESVKRRKG